jgi:hypothetical protein
MSDTHITPNQLGRIMSEFKRLGFDPIDDKTERLDLCSLIIYRDIDSLHQLLAREATLIIRCLIGKTNDDIPRPGTY